jgi:hypothetical protein
MKKFTLFSLIIGMLLSVSAFGQNVPNGDFEEWENSLFGFEVPVGWWTVGSIIGSLDIIKASPGQSGDYAAELTPVDFPGIGISAPTLMSQPFGVSQKYGQLTGWVEGTSVGADTLFILAMMTANSNIVGIGGGFISGVVDPYTKFEVDIIYEDGRADPDSCMISFVLGNSDGVANIGSEFRVDNLSLGGQSSINEIPSDFSTVGNPYPNPTIDYLNIPFELKTGADVTVKIFDINGRQLYAEDEKTYYQGSHELSIDIRSFTSGTYFYTLSTGKNSVATRTFVIR